MGELPAKDEKQEDEQRRHIKKLLKQLRQNRKGEDEAKALLKEMQINLDAAQARSAATELQMCSRLDEYMQTWEEDRGRPNFTEKMADVAEQRHRDPQF